MDGKVSSLSQKEVILFTDASVRIWRMAVVPTAAATALDIDLSNISIVFISVSFATMVSCFLHQ